MFVSAGHIVNQFRTECIVYSVEINKNEMKQHLDSSSKYNRFIVFQY